jgi:acetylglutamate kinase
VKETLTIVKIGGNVIDNETLLSSFLDSFAQITTPKMLIHGGGKLATQLSERLGITTNMVEGRRITDDNTIQVVTMTYAGWINKKIVALLQSKSCNVIGLSGADAALIPAVKRPVADIDYGWVGDILPEKINTSFLISLMQQNITPVIAPITCNAEGNLLNVNADTIAQSVAENLAQQFNVNLIYCFELNGVLKNINDATTLIEEIKTTEAEKYKSEGIISGGMIPKIDNAVKAIKKGVSQVVIGNAKFITQIVNGEKGYGTRICN